MANEKAILAGGCFWGVQELLRKMDGVVSTRVGYSGGDVPNATYRNHGTHAEAVEIVFRSEEHTSELPSLMRISYAVSCLQKKKTTTLIHKPSHTNTNNTKPSAIQT